MGRSCRPLALAQLTDLRALLYAVWLVAGIATTGTARAQDNDLASPVAKIRQIYETLEGGNLIDEINPASLKNQPLTQSYFAPAFIGLLSKDRRCWTSGREGNGEMWFSGQDYTITDLKIEGIKKSDATTVVSARFKNFGKEQDWSYLFELQGSRWVITDVLFANISQAQQMKKNCQ